ncbi:hypothetical protein [Aestuariivirga sp.]|uniref:hypothetical protein n=1 Tax=Aestuariivirga sp. TaxID=2650926 RepID=UPI00391B33B9
MDENVARAVSMMPRNDLERFALRAAVQLQLNRSELQAGESFLTLLTGFFIGVVVAVSGFLVGAGLG